MLVFRPLHITPGDGKRPKSHMQTPTALLSCRKLQKTKGPNMDRRAANSGLLMTTSMVQVVVQGFGLRILGGLGFRV